FSMPPFGPKPEPFRRPHGVAEAAFAATHQPDRRRPSICRNHASSWLQLAENAAHQAFSPVLRANTSTRDLLDWTRDRRILRLPARDFIFRLTCEGEAHAFQALQSARTPEERRRSRRWFHPGSRGTRARTGSLDTRRPAHDQGRHRWSNRLR